MFFSGRTAGSLTGSFDLLEKGGHSYLVKVKLKNLKDLLQKQSWEKVDAKTATCKFTHRCGNWQKGRAFYGVRILKEYVQKSFSGRWNLSPYMITSVTAAI